MGPRPDGRGKIAMSGGFIALAMRQWGRGQTAAERPGARLCGRNGFLRQWGRGQTAAERSCGRRLLAGRIPRQWGRGQTAAERLRGLAKVGTGKASMGPRPDGRGKAHNFWHGLRSGSVNGAAARRPRKGLRPVGITIVVLRQWGRGQTAAERAERRLHGSRLGRVNGAAARRPRKAIPLVTVRSRRGSVNGAAARRPRKGLRSPREAVPHAVASMGPRPDGRGKQIRLAAAPPIVGVNGAAARRPRKDYEASRAEAPLTASMGPRPDGRGKFHTRRHQCTYQIASMGPRPDGRGKRRPTTAHGGATCASMGPRPDGRGKFWRAGLL